MNLHVWRYVMSVTSTLSQPLLKKKSSYLVILSIVGFFIGTHYTAWNSYLGWRMTSKSTLGMAFQADDDREAHSTPVS